MKRAIAIGDGLAADQVWPTLKDLRRDDGRELWGRVAAGLKGRVGGARRRAEPWQLLHAKPGGAAGFQCAGCVAAAFRVCPPTQAARNTVPHQAVIFGSFVQVRGNSPWARLRYAQRQPGDARSAWAYSTTRIHKSADNRPAPAAWNEHGWSSWGLTELVVVTQLLRARTSSTLLPSPWPAASMRVRLSPAPHTTVLPMLCSGWATPEPSLALYSREGQFGSTEGAR